MAAPAGNVSLRGLAINGQGCNVGIGVQTGDVHIENCVISNIGGVGAARILSAWRRSSHCAVSCRR
ncbi:MAG TPA: hypothetical protein VET86_12375 [Casimicrobiaceae bacterium]|nr:hypothetical protein [Casimicrobiaceae bacterium]